MKNNILLAFSLIVLLAVTGCNKEKNSIKPTNTSTIQPSYTYFMKADLGGEQITIGGNEVAYNYVVDVPHTEEGEGHEHEPEEGEVRSTLVSGCNWSATVGGGVNTGTLELRKLVVRIYISPIMSQQFYTMLEPNSYNFSNASSNSGAYITLRDKNGVLWTSLGDQTGSTFSISDRGSFQNDYTTIAGTFSCKMYDGFGNMKLLSNGTFNAVAGL